MSRFLEAPEQWLNQGIDVINASSTTKEVEVQERRITSDEAQAMVKTRIGPYMLVYSLEVYRGGYRLTLQEVDGDGFWFFEDPPSLSMIKQADDLPTHMHWMMDVYDRKHR